MSRLHIGDLVIRDDSICVVTGHYVLATHNKSPLVLTYSVWRSYGVSRVIPRYYILACPRFAEQVIWR